MTLPNQLLPHRVEDSAPCSAPDLAKVPTRTCIGCRSQDQQSQLLRFVRIDSGPSSQVAPDYGRRIGGRGAWLHERKSCMQRALDRRAFERAFRGAPKLDVSLVNNMAIALAGADND